MRLEIDKMNNEDWFNLVGKQVKIMGAEIIRKNNAPYDYNVLGDVIAIEGKVIEVNLTSHYISVIGRKFDIGKIDILETVEPDLVVNDAIE